MSSIISLIVFACVFGGAMFGMFLHARCGAWASLAPTNCATTTAI